MSKIKFKKIMVACGLCLLLSAFYQNEALAADNHESTWKSSSENSTKLINENGIEIQSNVICSNCNANMKYAGMNAVGSWILYKTEQCPGSVNDGDAIDGYHRYYRQQVYYNYVCIKCSSTHKQVGYLTRVDYDCYCK